MRSGQEIRKKTRHKEFLNEILQHAKDFTEFHKKRQMQTKRKATIFKAHLDSRAKKDEKVKTVEDSKRKLLLRENNFDEWLKLINFEKNDRLMEILNSTNQYIQELGEKVTIQKMEVNKIRQGAQKKKESYEDEDDEEENEIKKAK
tara:strand:+ start:216 stop:653 length:438 start_codon:yes stop_codon:yes gene_type:complete